MKTNLTKLQIFYLELAIVAFFGTSYVLFQFLLSNGFVISQFIAAAAANQSAVFMLIEVAVLTLAYLVWMIKEARLLAMKNIWVYVLLCFAPTPAVSFPVFLFMRDIKLQQQRTASVQLSGLNEKTMAKPQLT